MLVFNIRLLHIGVFNNEINRNYNDWKVKSAPLFLFSLHPPPLQNSPDRSPGAARRHPRKPNRRAASAPRNPQKTQRVHSGGDGCLPQAVDAVCRAHTNTGRVHKHRQHAGVIVYKIHLYRWMRSHYCCAHTNTVIDWLKPWCSSSDCKEVFTHPPRWTFSAMLMYSFAYVLGILHQTVIWNIQLLYQNISDLNTCSSMFWCLLSCRR